MDELLALIRNLTIEQQVSMALVAILAGALKLLNVLSKLHSYLSVISTSQVSKLNKLQKAATDKEKKLYEIALAEESFKAAFGCYKSPKVRQAIAKLNRDQIDWSLVKAGIRDLTTDEHGNLVADLPWWKRVLLFISALIFLLIYALGGLLIIDGGSPPRIFLGLAVVTMVLILSTPLMSVIPALRVQKTLIC